MWHTWYLCLNVNVCRDAYICTYIHKHIICDDFMLSTCVHLNVHIHICIHEHYYVRMHAAYTYTYTHTHARMHTHTLCTNHKISIYRIRISYCRHINNTTVCFGVTLSEISEFFSYINPLRSIGSCI